MGRVLLLLPLCLLVRDSTSAPVRDLAPMSEGFSLRSGAAAKDEGSAVLPVALLAGAVDPLASLAVVPLIKERYSPAAVVASLVPLGGSPCLLVPAVSGLEETADAFYDRLRQEDPFAFLEETLRRYEGEIEGYTAVLRKRERIGGKLHDYEETRVWFRETPFSVYMDWTEFSRSKMDNFFASLKQPKRALYVNGQNDNRIVAVLQKTGLVMTTTVDSADSKNSSRFTIDQFGMGKGMERTLQSMRSARARGALHLKYVGETDKETRLGNVPIYIFVRKPYDPLEEDQLNELIIFIDKKHWMQVGSILKTDKGEIIAEYYFRDVVVNPAFEPDFFTRARLEKK